MPRTRWYNGRREYHAFGTSCRCGRTGCGRCGRRRDGDGARRRRIDDRRSVAGDHRHHRRLDQSCCSDRDRSRGGGDVQLLPHRAVPLVADPRSRAMSRSWLCCSASGSSSATSPRGCGVVSGSGPSTTRSPMRRRPTFPVLLGVDRPIADVWPTLASSLLDELSFATCRFVPGATIELSIIADSPGHDAPGPGHVRAAGRRCGRPDPTRRSDRRAPRAHAPGRQHVADGATLRRLRVGGDDRERAGHCGSAGGCH